MQSDEVARRAYWTQQLEAAYAFMFESILPYPVVECGEPFVSLREAAAQADVVGKRSINRVPCVADSDVIGVGA